MPEGSTSKRIDRTGLMTLAGLLILVPLLHASSLADPFALPKQTALIVGAALLAALAITAALLRLGSTTWRSPILWITLPLIVTAAVAVIPAVNRHLAIRGTLQLAAGALIAWSVTRFVRTPEAAAVLLRTILGVGALVACGTIVQVVIPGFYLAPGGWSWLPASGGGATLGEAGHAAQFLLLVFPAGIGAIALSPGRRRGLWGGCLGLVAAAIIFIGQPEGWVVGSASLAVLAVTAGVRLVARGGGWRACLPDLGSTASGAALIGLVVVIAVVTLSRMPGVSPTGRPTALLHGTSLLTPTSGDPALDRPAAVRRSWSLLALHPVGVGAQNWRHAFLEVAWKGADDSPFTLTHQPRHVGNSFVELATETGVLGGLLFVLFILALLIQAGRTGSGDPGPGGLLGFTVFNTLSAFVLMALYGSSFQEPAPALLVWIMSGLGQVAAAGSSETSRLGRLLQPQVLTATPRPAVAWIAAAALVAGTASGLLMQRDATAASRQTQTARTALFKGDARAGLAALEHPDAVGAADHLPHLLAGNIYLEEGHHEMAATRFTNVITRSPHFVAAYIGRSRAYESLGRYDLAELDLRTALTIWPNHTDSLLALADLTATRGRLDKALEIYRDVLRLDTTLPQTFFEMGRILFRLERFDEAITAYRACIRRDPQYPGLFLNLALALEEMGMQAEAVRSYETAVGHAPKSTEPRLRLANIYHASRRYCDARMVLEGTYDLEVDPQRRQTVLDLIDKVAPLCSSEKSKRR